MVKKLSVAELQKVFVGRLLVPKLHGALQEVFDRELSSFERSVESLTEVFGRNVVALQLPIGSEKGFRGVIDLVAMKAHTYKPDGDGKPTGEYEDFVTGFVVSDTEVWGRPVGVTVAKDGALLVSEDGNGTIWRVSRKQ